MMTPRSDVLLLVRADPESALVEPALVRAEELAGNANHTLVVFFHGPAVVLAAADARERWLALAGPGNARLWLCSAAWQRRCQATPGSGFEVSSLVRFWQEALVCERIECFGSGKSGAPGDAECTRRAKHRQSESFIVRVAIAPTATDAREVLELVLAGASLDIDLAVVFEGPGLGFLSPPWVRGWRQLVDFELATLYYRSGNDSVDPSSGLAQPIQTQALEGLLAERRAVCV